MTEAELQAIEARCRAASPGPWYAGEPDEALCEHRVTCRNIWADEGTDITSPCAGLSPEDAEFIAHSRFDVAALAAEVRRLWSLIDAYGVPDP